MTMRTEAWTALREALVLIEAARYRGQSGVKYDDLISLTVAAFGLRDDPPPGTKAREKARKILNPKGGALDCAHEFNPKIWADWRPDPDVAIAKAATDPASKSQYPGTPRGGTVMKRHYGGRVIYQPGRRDQSHENLPSAMDTYDVLMRADGSTLTRFAYAPAQGRFEERAARLEDLMSGRSAALPQTRPQPERPDTRVDPTKPAPDLDPDEEAQFLAKVARSAPDAPIAGGANRMGRGDKFIPPTDPDKRAPPSTPKAPRPKDSFADRIAKISRSVDADRRPAAPKPEDDDDEPLFLPKKDK